MTAANVQLSVEKAGGGALATSTTGSLNYTVASDGVYYVRIVGLSNQALRAQYLLQYYSGDESARGKFLHIKVTVPSRPELRIRAREGYYVTRK